MVIKTSIKPTGKQNQPFIKTSPLPFVLALAIGLFTLMVLWHLHPDVFGDLGVRLHDMLVHAPVVITGMIVAGVILAWVMVIVAYHNQAKPPIQVKQYYSTALFCLLVILMILVLSLFWLYFNGVAYYQNVLGDIQPENLNPLLVFDRMPIIITAEILLGFWVIKHFFSMLADGLVRHGWHLLIGLCVLSAVLIAQFLYLGMVQSQMPIMGLLGDVMMIAMFLYALIGGLIFIGVLICLVQMSLGHYQVEHSFSVIVLRELWGGLCLLWALTMLGIIIWRPIVA